MKAQYIRTMDALHRACLFVAGACLVVITLIIPEILVFSKRTFQSLPKDDQALILKLAGEAQQEQRTLWYEMEKKSIDDMKKAGVEIVDVADRKPFQAAVKPVWDKYGTQLGPLIQRIQDVK